MMPAQLKRFLLEHSLPRFLLVGGIGFLVDAGVLIALYHLIGLALLPARLLSFATAVTVTWWLNRRITFAAGASSRQWREWSRYTVVNGIGGTINLSVFLLLTSYASGPLAQPLPALAAASLIALLFNYTGSRLLVFTADGAPD